MSTQHTPEPDPHILALNAEIRDLEKMLEDEREALRFIRGDRDDWKAIADKAEAKCIRQLEVMQERHAELMAALRLILDQVDYTSGACRLTEIVGGCLDRKVISHCRAAIAKATGGAS